MSSAHTEESRLPWNTWLLSLAQALNVTSGALSVSVVAIVGQTLADTVALATLPYGMQFAATLACTYPASMLMRRYGRRLIFTVGALCLIAAGIIGYTAVARQQFYLLILAHVVLGSYMASANFYRFAATDGLPGALKARGISLVVAGGVVAAVLGPALAMGLRQVSGFIDFSLCYLSLSGLGVVTLIILAIWKPPPVPDAQNIPLSVAPVTRLTPQIAAAILGAASSFFVMTLLMIQASLVMKSMNHHFNESSFAIQAHVLAMFLPSFFTGFLINKLGITRTLMIGYGFLLGAGLLGLSYPDYGTVLASLILLGIGWNFGYVGGGAYISQHIDAGSRHRWQGIADTVVAASATLGAFLPAPLLVAFGRQGTNMIVVALSMSCALYCWKALGNRLQSAKA